MTTWTVKLAEKRQIADGTMEFRFEKPKDFDFRAGQFLDIILRGQTDAPKRDYIHGFSICAAPFEDYLAVATRLRGSPFKNALGSLPDGSEVQLDASYGNFTLPKDSAHPLVFIIGGIGVTPVRSMIAQSTHEKSGHKLTLIHANNNPAAAPFAEDFRRLAAINPDFTYRSIYTQSVGEDSGSKVEVVDADLIRSHAPNLAETVFYLSGPPGMVRAMREILMTQLKVDEDSIHTEEFDGY